MHLVNTIFAVSFALLVAAVWLLVAVVKAHRAIRASRQSGQAVKNPDFPHAKVLTAGVLGALGAYGVVISTGVVSGAWAIVPTYLLVRVALGSDPYAGEAQRALCTEMDRITLQPHQRDALVRCLRDAQANPDVRWEHWSELLFAMSNRGLLSPTEELQFDQGSIQLRVELARRCQPGDPIPLQVVAQWRGFPRPTVLALGPDHLAAMEAQITRLVLNGSAGKVPPPSRWPSSYEYGSMIWGSEWALETPQLLPVIPVDNEDGIVDIEADIVLQFIGPSSVNRIVAGRLNTWRTTIQTSLPIGRPRYK